MIKKTFLKVVLFCLIVLGLLLMGQEESKAQQSVVNIPSSSVLQPGEILLKDSNNFRPFQPDGFVSIRPSFNYGMPHNVNVSMGILTDLADENRYRANFTVKKVVFLPHSTRFTVETGLRPSLQESSTPRHLSYAHFSKSFSKTKTRLTAGMYLANGDSFLPSRPGVVLGLEQALFFKNMRLAVDWMSRNESYGRLSIGIKYRPTSTLSVTNAIMIPNGDRSNLAFKISLSKYFTPE